MKQAIKLQHYLKIDEGIKAYFNFRNYAYLLAIYLLGYSSLIISNFYYADDHVRRLYGGPAFEYVGRISSEYVIRLWNFSDTMLDAAPLFQLYAIILLASLSLMLCAIFKVKQSFLNLSTAAIIGLFPLLYGNMLYTVDAPFMIVSLVIAVVPFMFLNSKPLFYLSSFLASFLILTFYQVAITAYCILWILIILDQYLSKKEISFKAFGIAALCFLIGIILYKYSFPLLEQVGLVKTEIGISANFIQKTSHNFSSYIKELTSLLGKINLKVIVVLLLFFALAIAKVTQRNIVLSLAIVLLLALPLLVLSAGPNIFLTELPEMRVRYFLVFSFLIGILAIYGLKSNYKLVSIANLVILMYFINLSNGYGNAIKTKNKYRESIYTEFVYEFKQIVNNQPYEIYEVRHEKGTRDPKLFNVDSLPYQGKQQHSKMIAALIKDMDVGFDKLNLEAYILPIYGSPTLHDDSLPFELLKSRPEYDIYFDGRTAYKILFKY